MESTVRPIQSVSQKIKYALLLFAGLIFLCASAVDAQVIQLGSGSLNTANFPITTQQTFNYSQTIYTKDELIDAGAQSSGGTVTKIMYLSRVVGGSGGTGNFETWKIFMANTTKAGFANTNDWIMPANMTEVFTGNIPPLLTNNQWIEITLDTPFFWNGTDNLMVGVLENTPGSFPSVDWAAYMLAPSSGNKGMYKFATTTISPSNPGPSRPLTDQVAQIRLDGSFQSGCTGTPNGGTLPATIGVCPGLPFELHATGATAGQAGLVYQWEYKNSTTGNVWTDLPGATSNPYTVPSAPTQITNYRLRISCGLNTAYSNETVTFNRPPGECYCTPGGSNSNLYIDDFSTTGGVQNISNFGTGFAPGGYGDYTAMTVAQYRGDPIAFTAVLNQAPQYNYGFKIWVDWNGSGNFQVVYASSEFRRTHTGSFTVPLTAALGTTRMRIGISEEHPDGPQNPCDVIEGEFEDYSLEVLLSQNCSGTPHGGDINPATLSVCESRPFQIEAEGYTVGQIGLSGQWQYRNASTGGNWQNITGETLPLLQVEEAPGTDTDYRYALSCSYSGLTGYSTTFELKIKPPDECYCIPVSTNPADYISDFRTYGGDTDISYSATSSGGTGYRDLYDSVSGSIQAGGAMLFREGYFMGEHGFSLWVDLNKDGIFEESERLYDAEEISWAHEGEFAVPQSTLPGEYRMRIRASWNALSPPPCGEIPAGEAIDFKLIVSAGCAAEVLTTDFDPVCSIGPVDIQVTANAQTVKMRLYDSLTAGSVLAEINGNSGILTTPSLDESTLLYVAAVSASDCESERIPVEIEVGTAPSAVSITTTEEPVGSGEDYEYTRLEAVGGSYQATAYKDDFSDLTGHTWEMGWNGVNSGGYLNFGFSNTTQAGGEPYELVMYKDNGMPGTRTGDWWVYPYDSSTEEALAIAVSSFETLSLDFSFSLEAPSISIGTSNNKIYVMISTDGMLFEPIWERTVSKDIPMTQVHEDLSSYLGADQLFIRFQYSGSTARFDKWYIDDVLISGDRRADFSWAPFDDLFLDPALSIPYAGEETDTVYAAPVCTDSFTLTARGTGECEETEEVTLSRATSELALTGNWNTSVNWNPPAVPDIHKCVKVPTGRILTVNIPDAEAGSIEVEAGGKLRLTEGNSLTVMGRIRNEADAEDFVVESDASLLQIRAVENSGEITVQRKANVPYQQFNYWSSPVKEMPLYELYPGVPSQYVMTYNTWDDYFTSLDPASNPLSDYGIGYAVMGPQNGGPLITSEFKGVPHNESKTTEENRIPLAVSGNRFNLVGNPYPSNLDLRAMYLDNEPEFDLNLGDEITPAFYFWDNTDNEDLYQQGSNYSGLNYAAYNPNADIGVPAQGGDELKIPNGIVKPGQGFLIKVSPGATGLAMNNQMRTNETLRNGEEAVYYKDFDNEEAKFWIGLKTPAGLRTVTAVGYFELAALEFDKFDTPIVSESVSDNLYSLNKDGMKLTIQGRKGPFNRREVIPLGVRLYENGVYIFDAVQALGVFESLPILLQDKTLDILHNLSAEPYKFYGTAGDFEDRFEIRFSYFQTGFQASNAVLITRQEKDLRITSSEEKILEVQIYNLFGRQLASFRGINKNDIRIPAAHLDKQVLIVNVKTESGEITSEKVVHKDRE